MSLVRNAIAKHAADMALIHARAGDFTPHQLAQLIIDLSVAHEAQLAERAARGKVTSLLERIKEQAK